MTTAGLQMASPDCFKKPSLFVSPGAFSKGASRQWLSVGVGEEGGEVEWKSDPNGVQLGFSQVYSYFNIYCLSSVGWRTSGFKHSINEETVACPYMYCIKSTINQIQH
jgi:hypothetical protein